MKILIAGWGWLGRAVGHTLCARGDRVVALRRRPFVDGEPGAAGIEPLSLDLSRSAGAPGLPDDVDAVVACMAPRQGGLEAYERTYLAASRTLIRYYADRPLRGFVYTGSTGVFGQDDGGEVDEATRPLPGGERAAVLLRAEEQIVGAARNTGLPACIVRLSGLYGPGRFGVVGRVRDGKLALGPGDTTWMNFCHLQDAVSTVLAALRSGRAGAVYHASDAHPTQRCEVVRWISERIGVDATRGTRRLSPAAANRRVLAGWTRAQLGVELSYPSFREGLAEAVAPVEGDIPL